MHSELEHSLVLDGKSLTIERLSAHLEHEDCLVDLSPASWEAVGQASAFFDIVQNSGASCYGINTGFGDLIDYNIPPEYQEEAQHRLVLSHAVGTGEVLPPYIARAVFLLRLNCFAKGNSGIRPETLKTLLQLYNNKAYPEIFSQGSLGASGDLAPLAHLASFVIGQGYGYLDGKRVPAATIFESLHLSPVKLARKEGLSLINGTCAMTAIAACAVWRFKLYLRTMLTGMSALMEACRFSSGFLAAEAFQLKPHPGACAIADFLRSCARNDVRSDRYSGARILQPSYAFRCVPFILGPLRDTLLACSTTVEVEMNSSNDNPLYLDDEHAPYHGGHFHGQPVAVAMDQLRVAAAHLTGVVDRQLDAALDAKRGFKLPPFLSNELSKGDCGLAGAQYLGTSLHVENKMLASPFSPLTLPTNGGNQDYVSLGMHSALATLKMADNTRSALSIYLIAALLASSINSSSELSPAVNRTVTFLKSHLGPIQSDIPLSQMIHRGASDPMFSDLCALHPSSIFN